MLNLYLFKCFRHRKGYALRHLLTCAAIVLLAFTALACVDKAKPIVENSPDPIQPPKLEKRPDGIARRFLSEIKSGKYEKAYTVLDVDCQLRIPKYEFSEGLKSALKIPSTKKAYENREVIQERIQGSKAMVLVGDIKVPSAKPWVWEFTKTPAGWKIKSLDLPPVCIYRPSVPEDPQVAP